MARRSKLFLLSFAILSSGYDVSAQERAKETFATEPVPMAGPDRPAPDAKEKSSLSKFLSDDSVVTSTPQSDKAAPLETPTPSDAKFQSSSPKKADSFTASLSQQNDIFPSLHRNSTSRKKEEKSVKPNADLTTVPDIFVFTRENSENLATKDPIANWIGGSNIQQAGADATKSAWLQTLVPQNDRYVESINNDANVIHWGAYEESGQAPVIALETPLKPGTEGPPPLPRPEAIFLDPFGVNSWLRKRGIGFTFDNQNEFAGAITPPTKNHPRLKQGASNAGQYGFENDIDWETLAGVKGFETHALVTGRYGTPASRMFGENLNNSSEIYGGGGNVVVHLVYAYGEESLFSQRFRLAAGRMSLLTAFAKNPLACTFMNNAFCGNPKAANDVYTRVSFPGTNWAAKALFYPTAHSYIQAGIYFPEDYSYSSPSRRTGFKYSGAYIHGQAFPVEFGYLPTFGKTQLYTGHYKIGIVPDTSPHAENSRYAPRAGGAYYPTGYYPLGTPSHVSHFGLGAWAMFDQVILPHKTPANLAAGLVLLGGAWFNSGSSAAIRKYTWSVGLLDTGFWRLRPLDSVGINFGYTAISNWVKDYERFQINNPQFNPTANGRNCTLVNGSCGVQTSSAVLEMMYKIHVARGIYFSPDFQYYFRPGAQRSLRDAAMLGFKSHVQFF